MSLQPILAGNIHLLPADPDKQGNLLSPGDYTPTGGLAYVDGYRYRGTWKNLERSPGVYHWDELDALFAFAAANGKFISLNVAAGKFSPQWAFDAGAFKYHVHDPSASDNPYQPLPWDPVFQSQFFALIDALAARYGNNNVLRAIIDCGFMLEASMELGDQYDEGLFPGSWAGMPFVGTGFNYPNVHQAYYAGAEAVLQKWLDAFPNIGHAITYTQVWHDGFTDGNVIRDWYKARVVGGSTLRTGEIITSVRATLGTNHLPGGPHDPPTEIFAYPVYAQEFQQMATTQGSNHYVPPPDPNPLPSPLWIILQDYYGTCYTGAKNYSEMYFGDLVNPANAATLTAGRLLLLGNLAPPVPPPSPPPPPTGLAATAGDAVVDLTWNASSGATGYNVKRAFTHGGPYTTIASPSGTSYSDQSVTNGITYFYVVTATNANGESANSNEVKAKPVAGPPAPPLPPTGLVATPGDAVVNLSWNASAGATGYNIKRSLTTGGPYTTVRTQVAISYADQNVTNGVTYFYVVSAFNTGGESANSSEVSAEPLGSPPPAPTGLVATAGNARVDLSWNAVSEATSYNVKRATVQGGPYTVIGSPSSSSFSDSTVTNGTTYYYVVSAVNGNGESGNSSEVSATPNAPPPLTLNPPTFTPSSSESSNVDVTIDCVDAGAHIFYTLGIDPPDPTHDGDTATGATQRIGANSGIVNSGDGGNKFKALAYESGFNDSSTAVSGTFGTPLPPPPPPSGLEVIAEPQITSKFIKTSTAQFRIG